jgi:hypothetical protein
MTRRCTLLLVLGLFVGLAACKDDPKLKITGIEPETGDVNGNTYVVIKGNRFVADGPRNVKVYFGSRQGSVVRFASDRELVVQAPPGKPDEVVDVLVIFDPGGQKKLDKAFKFVEKQRDLNIDMLGKPKKDAEKK